MNFNTYYYHKTTGWKKYTTFSTPLLTSYENITILCFEIQLEENDKGFQLSTIDLWPSQDNYNTPTTQITLDFFTENKRKIKTISLPEDTGSRLSKIQPKTFEIKSSVQANPGDTKMYLQISSNCAGLKVSSIELNQIKNAPFTITYIYNNNKIVGPEDFTEITQVPKFKQGIGYESVWMDIDTQQIFAESTISRHYMLKEKTLLKPFDVVAIAKNAMTNETIDNNIILFKNAYLNTTDFTQDWEYSLIAPHIPGYKFSHWGINGQSQEETLTYSFSSADPITIYYTKDMETAQEEKYTIYLNDDENTQVVNYNKITSKIYLPVNFNGQRVEYWETNNTYYSPYMAHNIAPFVDKTLKPHYMTGFKPWPFVLKIDEDNWVPVTQIL